MNDLPSAEQALKEATALQDGTEIRNKLSYVLYLQGRNEEARLNCRKRLSRRSPSPSIRPIWRPAGISIRKWACGISPSMLIPGDPGASVESEILRVSCRLLCGDRTAGTGISGLRSRTQFEPGQGASTACEAESIIRWRIMRGRRKIRASAGAFAGSSGRLFQTGTDLLQGSGRGCGIGRFDEVLRLVPEHADSYLYKAHIYYSQFEHEDAIQAIVNWSLHLQKEMPRRIKSKPSKAWRALKRVC